MLQTNNTGVCLQCLSHPGPAPVYCAHSSGSRLLRWELSEAGPGLHAQVQALRWSSEAQTPLGPHFVPFPGPSSSGVWQAWSLRLIASLCCSVFWVYSWRPFSGG